jgi:hypothetical protein
MINPTSNASRERGMLPALFFVALATVMFEVLLTRIFSLTMWFHFAFMAISIAMFGLTVGALMVYLWPHRWPARWAAARCGWRFPWSSLSFCTCPSTCRARRSTCCR